MALLKWIPLGLLGQLFEKSFFSDVWDFFWDSEEWVSAISNCAQNPKKIDFSENLPIIGQYAPENRLSCPKHDLGLLGTHTPRSSPFGGFSVFFFYTEKCHFQLRSKSGKIDFSKKVASNRPKCPVNPLSCPKHRFGTPWDPYATFQHFLWTFDFFNF